MRTVSRRLLQVLSSTTLTLFSLSSLSVARGEVVAQSLTSTRGSARDDDSQLVSNIFNTNVRSTKFHVDNDLPFPIRVRAIRDGRDDIWQTLQPGQNFRGNIDRRDGVRVVVYGPEDCGDEEIMPSAYARVYSTETFRIKPSGILREVADEVDPYSRVAGAALTGIALYYAPEYGPQILSELGVNEADLAPCITNFASAGCATGVVSYAQNLHTTYGDGSVATNECLQTAQSRAQIALGQEPTPTPEATAPGNEVAAGRDVGLTQNLGKSVASQTTMPEGSFLQSADGRWRAVMQGDGNLVIYGPSGAIWASNTNGVGTPSFRLVMQSDGNLVVYDADRATWATSTNGRGVGPYTLVMQDDANLVLYDSRQTPTWDSGTCCR